MLHFSSKAVIFNGSIKVNMIKLTIYQYGNFKSILPLSGVFDQVDQRNSFILMVTNVIFFVKNYTLIVLLYILKDPIVDVLMKVSFL